MRLSSRKWRWFGLVVGLLLVAFLVVRTWVVPAIIVSQIQARYRGKVVVGDWWFGLHSAGISGVKFGETSSDDSPIWFSADRISTDISLARLIRGRVKPTRIEVDRPKIAFRLDSKGQPITKIPVAPASSGKAGQARMDASDLPDIITKDGELTFQQEGRKPMTIQGIEARLAPASDGGNLTVKTDDPTWGQVAIDGHFDPSFRNGVFQITSSPGFVADPEKLGRIPFIPSEVWSNIEPRGPVDARVKIDLAADSPRPVSVHTEITFKGTTTKLDTLQVEATDTTGRIVIDNALVKLQDVKGRTLDGSIASSGTLDFSGKVPRFDLDLRLRTVDVTKAPASWQLGEVGATGRLSGKVDLKVAITPTGPDLSGSAGRAVIEDGSLQGIPIKSLSLGMRADGNDLQYETLPQGAVDKDNLDEAIPAPSRRSIARSDSTPTARSVRVEIWEPVLASLPLIELASGGRGLLGWMAFAVSEVVALQVKQAPTSGGGIRLPRTISTQIELEDVDLLMILEKGKKFGITIPVPVAGKLSIKATATIPLGALRDIKGYVFKGDATLKGASIDHVDLGLVTTHVELIEGQLSLSNLRGQLVDHPSGDANHPPTATAMPPAAGALPPGAFRGRLQAAVSPRGGATAHFEGDRLPLGEFFAPVLPNPSPLSGEITLKVDAKVDLANLADSRSWALDGHIDSRRIKYRDAVLDEVVTQVHLKAGRVELPAFAAKLLGRPLNGKLGLDLAPPHRYDGQISIDGWEIAKVLGFVPGSPSPSPASGSVDARAEAHGTLQPFDITTKGGARVLHARVGSTPVGNVAFRWSTEHEAISITGLEIFAFGGKVVGNARIPTKPGSSLQASATIKGIDTARLSAAFQSKGVSLSGLADGHLTLSMPLDASIIDADASLFAPDLKVHEGAGGGIPVESLKVTAVARKGILDYDATAESLGGKLLFHGSTPLTGDLSKAVAEARLQAVGFHLGDVWKGLGMSGGLSHLDGVGAFNSNIRARLRPFQPYSRGIFEMRDLRYGHMLHLGNVQGIASLGPTGWRIEQVNGELLGGAAFGEAHSERIEGGSKLLAFDFKVDRASLSKMAMAVPHLAREVDGYGSLRVAGRVAESLQASAEVLVAHATVMGIPVSELRFPAEVEVHPLSGSGSIHARHWSARLAGGSARGSASLRLGSDRSFQSEIQLTGVDIEVISRLRSNGKKSASGKVSGKISLSGPHADHVSKMKGKVDLDLDDASLVELPVFKQLDRFLGGAKGGGLFEDGDLHGTIFNRTLFVEQLTLNGRLIQVHATGTVTFDGGLNLEVLVNTKDVIPQSGLALVNIIPGLGQALGRGEQAVLRVASFLESRLLKFRVTGSMGNPNVQLDPGVAVGDTAVGFFSSVLRVPPVNGR